MTYRQFYYFYHAKLNLMLKMVNQKGFGLIVIFLFVLVVSVVGLTGLLALRLSSNETKTINRPKTTSSIIEPPKISPETPIQNDACANGRVIVYFKDGVSKAKQQGIISAENAAVGREYDQFNAYSLNVTKGQETTKAYEFAKYSEVKSATPEGCPDSTNAPDQQ